MLWEDSIGPWDHEIHSMGHINKNLIAIGDQRKQERMKNKLIKVKGEVERIHKCGVACWRLGCQGRRREINVGRVSEDEELMMITKKVKLKTSYDTEGNGKLVKALFRPVNTRYDSKHVRTELSFEKIDLSNYEMGNWHLQPRMKRIYNTINLAVTMFGPVHSEHPNSTQSKSKSPLKIVSSLNTMTKYHRRNIETLSLTKTKGIKEFRPFRQFKNNISLEKGVANLKEYESRKTFWRNKSHEDWLGREKMPLKTIEIIEMPDTKLRYFQD